MKKLFDFTPEQVQASLMSESNIHHIVDVRIRGHAKMVDIVLGCIILNSTDKGILGVHLKKMKDTPLITYIFMNGVEVAIVCGSTEYTLTSEWSSLRRGSIHKSINWITVTSTTDFNAKFKAEVTHRVLVARNRAVPDAVAVICKWNQDNPSSKISIISGQGGTVHVGSGGKRQDQSTFLAEQLLAQLCKSPELIAKEDELTSVHLELSLLQSKADKLKTELELL